MQAAIQRLKKDKEALERDLERSNASAARQNREAHLPPCIRIAKRHLEGDPGYMSVQKDVTVVATHFENGFYYGYDTLVGNFCRSLGHSYRTLL